MAVHAAAEHALAWPLETKATPTVAVLEANNQERLLAIVEDLEASGSKVLKYYEPDIGGELASIASIHDGYALRHLPLLLHGREVRT